ncbi:MAG: flavodoxin domain-containing protein [Rhodanobacteraceae bacterium]|nr:flavodoxin domain-containing protein [Rhodanobacteraceae bacterium]
MLYGSNTGSAEAFAERIASDAPQQGYAVQVAPLDEHTAGCRPTAVVLLTASYEGQPPDNARQFAAWLDSQGADALKGVRYAVFGCGNRQWARTYRAVPKRFDAALEAAGATRIKDRGETDSGGDFFGAFDDWYAGLGTNWASRPARRSALAPTGGQLDVEIVNTGRTSILRHASSSTARWSRTSRAGRHEVAAGPPLKRHDRHRRCA